MLIICLLNFTSFANYIRFLIFDFVDIITFSSLTSFWLMLYFGNKYVHKEYTSNFDYSFIAHIHKTRHYWGFTPFRAEEDSFVKRIELLVDNPNQLAFEVNQYWKNQGYS